MEIQSILHESERNAFQNPEDHTYAAVTTPLPQRLIEAWYEKCANTILDALGRQQSKITVGRLLEIIKKETAAKDFVVGTPLGTIEAGEGLTEPNLITTIKLLANCGFIKLIVYEQLQASLITKFFATASPRFRFGKFEL